MKNIKLILLAGMLLATAFTTAKAQSADDIMAKHVQAIGGAENWDKIKTLKMSGNLAQQGMEINITQTLAVGRAMRVDFSVMGMSGYQIVTQTDGWMYMPFQGSNKIDTMKPEMAKMMRQQMDIKGHQMLNYKAKGTRVVYGGIDTVGTAPCYKVLVTDTSGNQSTSFFDMTTYYLMRAESKIKQDEQEMEISITYDNYKKLDAGIVMPMTVNAQGLEIAFKTIEVNKPIDESVFIPTVDKQ